MTGQLLVPHIGLPDGPLTGPEAFAHLRKGLLDGLREPPDQAWADAKEKMARWMAGLSDSFENKVNDLLWNDPGTTIISADPYLGMTTVAVTDTMTSASVTEPTYTGYARLQIANSNMGASSGGSKTNSAQVQFAACTAGSSTVIGWFTSPISTTGGAGDVIMYGTATSTVIDTTHTPPQIGAGVLGNTAD